ncbi:MAG: hypothetical protein E6R07_03935 [Nevskiaceae bacterium]|nr:MAG: hypothetical protein E6R07_03935 [Nevskiaceae bacterium]
MSAETPRVYVIDRIVAKPGQAEALDRAYRERYAAGALARGMRLELSLLSPPVHLAEQSNTLLYVWSVAGAGGYWAMCFQGRQDPALQDWWWREAAALIETRERLVASDPADVATLGAMPC